MNRRLRGFLGLAINYTLLLLFAIVFANGIHYLLDGGVDIVFLVGTVVAITMKHMRNYWIDIIFGNRKRYFNNRPGFTDEILDVPPAPEENNSDLKHNPLSD